MQIFLTIISGVSVFVIGQIILKVCIDPIQEQRRVIGRIINATLFYSHDPDDILKAHEEVSKITSDLLAASALIPFYSFFEGLNQVFRRDIVLPRDTANRVIFEMRGWSGMTDAEGSKESIRRIKALLKLTFGLPKDQTAVEKMEAENERIYEQWQKGSSVKVRDVSDGVTSFWGQETG